MVQKEKLRTGQHSVRAGEYIFMEGEQHTTAFTLKEGWAICYKVLSNGQRQIVHIAIAGDFLGYKTNYSTPVDYSVKAITDCVVCSFSEESIKELLSSDPKLIMRLLEIQEKQNTACRLRLSYMGQAQAKQKIAYFLSSLIERLERRGFDMSKKVSFPLTREEIADAIGVTTVHLSRVSVELHTSNIVDCKHGYNRDTFIWVLNKGWHLISLII